MTIRTPNNERRVAALVAVLILSTVFAFVSTTSPAGAAPDSTTTIDAHDSAGRQSSTVIGPDGNPVIAYYDGTASALNLVKCTNPTCAGPQNIVEIDGAGLTGQHPSLALNSAGNPVIVYYAAGATVIHEDGLRRATCHDTACASVTIDVIIPDTEEVQPDLALLPDGRPVVGFVTGGVAVATWCQDVACDLPIDGTFLGASDGISVDAEIRNGVQVFAYTGDDPGEAFFVTCPDVDCDVPSQQNLGSGADHNSDLAISLDANGIPTAAYIDWAGEALEFAVCSNPSCSGAEATYTQTQAGEVYGLSDIDIVRDPHGRPVVAFHAAGTQSIKVVHCLVDDCRGGNRVTTPVPTNADGTDLGLAMGADGNAVFSWFQGVDHDMMLEVCGTHGCGQIPTLPGSCSADPGTANVIHGTDGDDIIEGTNARDIIFGHHGADVIDGLDGADCIFGGAGRDNIHGGSGNDVIHGNTARDTIRGGSGHDVIKGQKARDTIFGGPGNDNINGGSARDTIFGNTGDDTLRGKSARDTLVGGKGFDALLGGKGKDTCTPDGGTVSSCETVS